ncbi:sterigmatocystin biosynthesis monooxygenase stcW [Pestalotiopsis fici W106-1]|uniref:Sterigmatocystin biosynthesis monooxygenase stcW n=1 Tax=Pestalotiopsis fici (strain W106-1 / CGMCC3.15140) TaxID=1229662 RepID=W3XEI0_PESFW|nr:sterigmatocystin biosynthesis monooxygenase stcW [Pestalotiopsis fici W106-1]ETS84424.1 sterigmatocystin biosynthesis monooxygenase stcW [Pestalotiopsis fici W106-1]
MLDSGGKWDYSVPGSSGYHIPNIKFNDPNNRPLRVIMIGAGVSGIMMGYKMQKECPDVDFKIYEKNETIGGTWFENRYPGCGCDIPSHAYVFPWAPNPDWPRFFSYAADIWQYLDKVCEVFNLREKMTFNTEVIAAEWQESSGTWKVKLQKEEPGKESSIFEDECDVLFNGSGVLNNFKKPHMEGLELFKGRVIHTADWDRDYQAEQWKGQNVAVIGSGASSVQTVPTMQPHVKHMDIFVRTGVWFAQIANNYGQNHEYSSDDKQKFRDPAELAAHAKNIEDQINGLADVFYTKTKDQQAAQDFCREWMAEHIKDERLLQGYTPKFDVGCRRLTPGDPYMAAIGKENVDVHFTAAERITAEGVQGADGVERKVDTIIFATGFDVSYRPRFPVIGRNGVSLSKKWAIQPEAYMGLTVPDMPNYLMFIGPTWPIANGSVMGPLEYVSRYCVMYIKKMQRDCIKSLAPKQYVTDKFNEHAQEWYKYTVWKDSCRSWYKNNDTGRINAVWPGSSLHFTQVVINPRWEDYDISYVHDNPFASLGMGHIDPPRSQDNKGADLSEYIQPSNIDPKWVEAMNGVKNGVSNGIGNGIENRT